MTQSSEAEALARALGVVQEALRLGHERVGSEHALIASFADPVVRWALMGVGCDLRDVQAAVKRVGGERNRDHGGGVALTVEAEDLILRAAALVPDLDPGERDPAAYSAAFGAVMTTVLNDDRETAASRILDEFDVRRHAPQLAAAIRDHAGPSGLPRTE